MTSPKIRTLLVAAALAGVAAPALAQDYYYVAPDDYYFVYDTPATTVIYEEPVITVYGQPLTQDQRITSDVVDAIANDPRVSGNIEVLTRNNDVTLSGNVTTPGQARHAMRDARDVPGVRSVRDDLRARVGGRPD